ncbi:hypothetical protein CBD41_05265 [bacterium TMED181]|nr:hypothetical protein [Planctomycetota bacterium]OUW44700.1 MAG: hypothetical protein CBD41_05265 [bacterium TMED181]
MPTEAGGDWHDLCAFAEVDAEEPFFTQAGGRELMVIRVADEVSVFTDSCPHIGASMMGAMVEDGHVECPLHGACFDARTGKVSDGPTDKNLQFHPAKVDGDRVFVKLQPATD